MTNEQALKLIIEIFDRKTDLDEDEESMSAADQVEHLQDVIDVLHSQLSEIAAKSALRGVSGPTALGAVMIARSRQVAKNRRNY